MNKITMPAIKKDVDAKILDIVYSNHEAFALVKKLLLSNEQIVENYSLIYKYLVENKCCFTCLQAINCPKETKGCFFDISINEYGHVSNKLIICEKYKTIRERFDNIIYTTNNLDEIDLQLSISNFSKLIGNLPNRPANTLDVVANIWKMKKSSGLYFHISEHKNKKEVSKAFVSIFSSKYKTSYISMPKLITTLKNMIKEKVNYTSLLDKIMRSNLLILDDLGSENISEWTRDEILSSILDYRLENSLVTIFFSDYDIEQLDFLYMINNDKLKATKLINKIRQMI